MSDGTEAASGRTESVSGEPPSTSEEPLTGEEPDFAPRAAAAADPAEDGSSRSQGTLAILGLGLMGGSLGLALAGKGWRRLGWDPLPEARRGALHRGAVDELAASPEAALGVADGVVLAAPVRQILELLPQVERHAREGALVLDLGSTKQTIVQALAGMSGRTRPVGGHPFCGKSASGIHAAEASLYHDAPFVLCPVPGSPEEALEEAARLVRALGARPVPMEAETHDRLAAQVSHLPYLLSVALLRLTQEEAYALASSGFRDATRLAATSEAVAADILLTNLPALRESLAALRSQLDALEDLLTADPVRVTQELAEVRRARQALEEAKGWS